VSYGKAAGNTKKIGTVSMSKGLKPGALAQDAKGSASASAARKKKPLRSERLKRAADNATKISEKRWRKASELGDAFAQRRAITRRAGRKGYMSALNKEELAGASSAASMRAAQRSDRRAENLRASASDFLSALKKAQPRAKGPRQIQAARSFDAVPKPKGLNPGALAARRKKGGSRVADSPVMVRGNFRPQGIMAKTGKAPSVFGKTKSENIDIAKSMIEKAGVRVHVDTRRNTRYKQLNAPMGANKGMNTVSLHKSAEWWSNPKKTSIAARRSGQISTSDPRGPIFHELGHMRDKTPSHVRSDKGAWGLEQRPFMSKKNKILARRVSQYATTAATEFTAEVYAGRRTGRRYDNQVMRAYRQELGLPSIRTGSRVARGAAPIANPRAVSRDRKRRSR
jgi:hypothetical protein